MVEVAEDWLELGVEGVEVVGRVWLAVHADNTIEKTMGKIICFVIFVIMELFSQKSNEFLDMYR